MKIDETISAAFRQSQMPLTTQRNHSYNIRGTLFRLLPHEVLIANKENSVQEVNDILLTSINEPIFALFDFRFKN